MCCINCGLESKNPKFCSRSCSVSYNNRLNPKIKRTTKCVECNTLIVAGITYCVECSNDIRRKPNKTIGEIQCNEKYQISSRIRQAARQTYRHSDKPKQCVMCGYAKHYEVCHIKAINQFDSNTRLSEVNDINNLVALCRNCHWELDHGLISISP